MNDQTGNVHFIEGHRFLSWLVNTGHADGRCRAYGHTRAAAITLIRVNNGLSHFSWRQMKLNSHRVTTISTTATLNILCGQTLLPDAGIGLPRLVGLSHKYWFRADFCALVAKSALITGKIDTGKTAIAVDNDVHFARIPTQPATCAVFEQCFCTGYPRKTNCAVIDALASKKSSFRKIHHVYTQNYKGYQ